MIDYPDYTPPGRDDEPGDYLPQDWKPPAGMGKPGPYAFRVYSTDLKREIGGLFKDDRGRYYAWDVELKSATPLDADGVVRWLVEHVVLAAYPSDWPMFASALEQPYRKV